MTRRGGFSLIELIVTISIIAVLIGILLPVLPRARDAAEQAACLSNQRQIGLVMETYLEDNRREFPVARYMPDPWLKIETPDFEADPPLTEALADRMEPASGIWKCPGDRVVYDVEYTDENGEERIGGSSYSYSSGLAGRKYEETGLYRRLGLPASEFAVLKDFDGAEYETQDGRLIQVDWFHAARVLLYADMHADRAGS